VFGANADNKFEHKKTRDDLNLALIFTLWYSIAVQSGESCMIDTYLQFGPDKLHQLQANIQSRDQASE
jgi:hypothetical protein